MVQIDPVFLDKKFKSCKCIFNHIVVRTGEGKGLVFNLHPHLLLAHLSRTLKFLLIACCPSVCKLFTFSFSSQDPLGQFQPHGLFQANLTQSIFWWKGLNVLQIRIFNYKKEMICFLLSESTQLSTNMFIDLKRFLRWAMWPMGLLFANRDIHVGIWI